jgi:GH24 family phage-related lysozyme (muramidase)
MHQSVADAFHAFSQPLEGRVPSMYLDILGLITCGVGNLIDPISAALPLPWKRDSDGALASQQEIRDAWTRLKNRPDLAKKNVSHARALTGLHLDDSDIDALVDRKLSENERFITGWLPSFPEVPADAQLGILSMAWAVGPGFNRKFPTFTRAATAGDWFGAQASCKIREAGNPGVVPRNARNRVCFGNAHTVATLDLDRSILHWPSVATDARPPAETVPDAAPEPFPLPPADPVASTHETIQRANSGALAEMSGRDDGDSEPPGSVA